MTSDTEAAATPSSTFHIDRVALIGIGLIGSSLARALRQRKLVDHIAVAARSVRSAETALRLGIADSATTDVAAAVADADLVMLCTPVGTFAEIATVIAPHLKPGCIVTDAGSTKQSVIRDVGPHLPEGVYLVPGHPIAGTEHSGPEAGFAELFEERFCVLTPAPGTDPTAVATVRRLWESVGMTVHELDAQHHDVVLAITSHLPHLIAYTIVSTATELEEDLHQAVIRYSAGGFRDFTRIAASDPVMWRDIFLHNREAILEILQRFNEDLTALQRAIRWGEGETLEALFRRTREIRRGVIEAKQA